MSPTQPFKGPDSTNPKFYPTGFPGLTSAPTPQWKEKDQRQFSHGLKGPVAGGQVSVFHGFFFRSTCILVDHSRQEFWGTSSVLCISPQKVSSPLNRISPIFFAYSRLNHQHVWPGVSKSLCRYTSWTSDTPLHFLHATLSDPKRSSESYQNYLQPFSTSCFPKRSSSKMSMSPSPSSRVFGTFCRWHDNETTAVPGSTTWLRHLVRVGSLCLGDEHHKMSCFKRIPGCFFWSFRDLSNNSVCFQISMFFAAKAALPISAAVCGFFPLPRNAKAVEEKEKFWHNFGDFKKIYQKNQPGSHKTPHPSKPNTGFSEFSWASSGGASAAGASCAYVDRWRSELLVSDEKKHHVDV